MFNIHPLWLIVVLVVVLIIFGPGKLPELGGALGKTLREFRKATSELKDEVTKSTSTEASTATPATAPPAEPTKADPTA